MHEASYSVKGLECRSYEHRCTHKASNPEPLELPEDQRRRPKGSESFAEPHRPFSQRPAAKSRDAAMLALVPLTNLHRLDLRACEKVTGTTAASAATKTKGSPKNCRPV